MDFGFYNMDCMEGMKQFPDKFFDLAIVDPPYGDGEFSEDSGGWNKHGKHLAKYGHPDDGRKLDRTGRTWAKKYGNQIVKWDVAPTQEYFDELFRVSKNQIIWGGELLHPSADAVLRYLEKADDQRELHHGDGGVCVDQFQ